MTNTDIIKLATEAHLFDDDQEPIVEHLEQFAALVTQAEREACHALRQTLPNPMAHCQTSAHAYDMAIVHYGKAIRARNHVVDANKMDCTDCDCADNDPCKRTAPGLALESGEFVPAEKITDLVAA